MIDLAELEAKALAATQGEWSVEPHGSARALFAGRNNERHGLRLLNLDDGDRNIAPNAAYIVAAQPSVVLELIERVRAAEAKAGEPRWWASEDEYGFADLYSTEQRAESAAKALIPVGKVYPLYAAPPDVSARPEVTK